MGLLLMAYGIGLALGEAVREKALQWFQKIQAVFWAFRLVEIKGELRAYAGDNSGTFPPSIPIGSVPRCPNSCLKFSSCKS